MYFKIDHSIEAKKNFRLNMAGMFAIYYKKHLWNKWIQLETYSTQDYAYFELKGCCIKEKYKKVFKFINI